MHDVIKYLKRKFKHYKNVTRKFFTTYMVIGLCSAAVISLQDSAPIYPLGYHSLFWLMALIFPGLAMTYSLVRLRVRQNEILAVCQREEFISNVYLGKVAETMEPDDVELAFQDYVQQRVEEYYGLWEFSGYSILAGMITFIMAILIGQQFAIPNALAATNLTGPTWAVLVGSAFLGSYAGSLTFLLRKYRSFDLRPTAFLQIAFMLITGTLAGSFFTIAFPSEQVGIIAFIVGYLSAVNIEFLSQLLRKRFAKLTNIELPEPKASDLPDMLNNPEAIEGLHGISIYSIRELSEADPIRLYLSIPQELSIIGAMIDEAILRANFPTIIEDLKNVHITRFTQLVSHLNPHFRKNNTAWTDNPVVLNDEEKDKIILEAVKSLFDNGTYHFSMGLLIHRYRQAYYKPHPHKSSLPDEHKEIQFSKKLSDLFKHSEDKSHVPST